MYTNNIVVLWQIKKYVYTYSNQVYLKYYSLRKTLSGEFSLFSFQSSIEFASHSMMQIFWLSPKYILFKKEPIIHNEIQT